MSSNDIARRVVSPTENATNSTVDPTPTSPETVSIRHAIGSTTLPRYVLGAEIARGGMGVVYRASDSAFGREVAVKVLLERYSPESATARRFHDEARITGQLQHPGIPPVFDLGTLPDGRMFLAMKLIKGNTLDQLLASRSDPATDSGQFLAIFEKICEAVAYAHSLGVIHRDLKPQNVMVGRFGEVQVMDWGLAKVMTESRLSPVGDMDLTQAETEINSAREGEDLLTQDGSVLGTPAYMPPEQAIGAINEIDARSDVFGLGGILSAVLTGRPPFVGNSAEDSRVMAAKGKVADCFARLLGCGADPELVALAKRCLAPEKAERPSDAGAVAACVAQLRQAADERARRADLEKIQAESEVAAAAAASTERRKRRRLWIGAATALVLAVVTGLGAVLWVQRNANAELSATNKALQVEQAKVEQRFEMARKAIAAFHTTIDEQPELGNEAFKPLRKKLLESAAEFYVELEGLLKDEADASSKTALAGGFFQLGELTEKIGDKKEALELYRKALLLRRELASSSEADVNTRLAVSETLRKAGVLAASLGDLAEAQAAIEEAREIAADLESEAPTTEVRRARATSLHAMGVVLTETGKSAEALDSFSQSREVLQQLADANPDVASCQRDLAGSHNNIGLALYRTGQLAEALNSCDAARVILQKLVTANPDVIQYQRELGWSLNLIGILCRSMGKIEDALSSHEAARDIRKRLSDANPAVDLYQSELAGSHQNIANLRAAAGEPIEALASYEAARDIQRRLAEAHPSVTVYLINLATTLQRIGELNRESDKPAEALTSFESSLIVRQRLAESHPDNVSYLRELANNHSDVAKLLGQLDRSAESLSAYQNARDIWQKLADAPSTDPIMRAEFQKLRDEVGK